MGLIIGGYDASSYPKIQLWDSSLSSYTSYSTPDDNPNASYFMGRMALSQSRNEVWIPSDYDAVHCLNATTGAYIATVNIYAYSTWWQIYTMEIDGNYLYVGMDDGKVHQIDLTTRTVTKSVTLPNSSFAHGLTAVNATIGGTGYHFLYVASNGNYIYKYSLDDFTYVSTYTHTKGFLNNSDSLNSTDGYIYYGEYTIGKIIRYDFKTDSISTQTYSNQYLWQTVVENSTGNVYAVTTNQPTAKARVVKFDKDLNYIGVSSDLSFSGSYTFLTFDQSGSKIYVGRNAGNVGKLASDLTIETQATSGYTSQVAVFFNPLGGLYFRSTGTNAGYYTKDSTSPSLLTSKDSNGMINAGGSPSPYLDYSTATDFYRKEF